MRARHSLLTRMVGSYLILALLTVAAITLSALVVAQRSNRDVALVRLEGLASFKERELERWIEEKRRDVEILARVPELESAVARLAHEPMRRLLGIFAQGKPDLREVFVLAVPGGRVLASTEPRHEGAYQVNATYFERGRHATFVQSVYVSPETTAPMMTIAAPLRDRRDELRAVVCAHLSLATLEAIVGERAGIPADTYVVNRAGELVSGSDRSPEGPQRGLHSEGIDAALRGETGRGAYLDHAAVPVFGSYRWLPQLELGLLVEIPQARAYWLTQRLVGALALAGLVAVVGLSVGIYSLGRRVVRPILDITETANRVAEGDLTAVAPVTTEDEVGALALTFNAMTAELRTLYVGLQQSEARTRGIVDSALDAVVTFDVNGRITGWNPQAERLLGFSAEEATGQDVVESVVPEWDRERHRRGLARFRETGAAPFVNRRFEMTGLDRGGREFPVELTVAALPTRETMEFSAFIRDLRERKRAEEERARFEAAMEKAKTLSAMGTLVAGVAHEVRNPLFGISSILDAFTARFGETGENSRYLGELRTQVERLSRLMADLLEYGKPPALELAPGRLAEVVEQAAGACSDLALRSQVEIRRRLGDELPTVRMDRGRLTQVFQNLIDNAIRHSPAGSVVEVEAARVAADGVECTVRDSGPGFQSGDLDRLFEPFFTRRQGGTGLGLSIVQRIVEQHGGAVTAANHAEGGALFTVRLPLGESPSEAAPRGARG